MKEDKIGNDKRKKDFLPFEEAREFARSLNLKNRAEWRDYCRSGKKPQSMPSTVDRVYKDNWNGWSDFLKGEFAVVPEVEVSEVVWSDFINSQDEVLLQSVDMSDTNEYYIETKKPSIFSKILGLIKSLVSV